MTALKANYLKFVAGLSAELSILFGDPSLDTTENIV